MERSGPREKAKTPPGDPSWGLTMIAAGTSFHDTGIDRKPFTLCSSEANPFLVAHAGPTAIASRSIVARKWKPAKDAPDMILCVRLDWS